jgi:hypothetical protein
MDTTSIILKTDSRGRVRTPAQRRAQLLAEFERSGLLATKFAELVGVKYQTFCTWVQQQRKVRMRAARRLPTNADHSAQVRLLEAVPSLHSERLCASSSCVKRGSWLES